MSDHVDGGDVDKQASQQRVRQLERQLDAVERERDDLERDVEQARIASATATEPIMTTSAANAQAYCALTCSCVCLEAAICSAAATSLAKG